jgi:hypothetical protein
MGATIRVLVMMSPRTSSYAQVLLPGHRFRLGVPTPKVGHQLVSLSMSKNTIRYLG